MNELQNQNSKGDISAHDSTHLENNTVGDEISDTVHDEQEITECVRSSGDDEEDTAATSRSGSTLEKEMDVGVVDHATKLHDYRNRLVELLVLVFPSVWETANTKEKTEGDEQAVSSPCLPYATLDLENETAKSLNTTDNELETSLNLLDEMCFHCFQRRFLEGYLVGKEEEDETEVIETRLNASGFTSAVSLLLNRLEKAVARSFAAKDKYDSSSEEEDVVKRMELFLSQRARWSSVALLDDSQILRNDTNSVLTSLPLRSLQSLLSNKEHQHVRSWKEVNVLIDSVLRGSDDKQSITSPVVDVDGTSRDENDSDTDKIRRSDNSEGSTTEMQAVAMSTESSPPLVSSTPSSPMEQDEEDNAKQQLDGDDSTLNNDNKSGAKNNNSNCHNSPGTKKRKRRKGKKKVCDHYAQSCFLFSCFLCFVLLMFFLDLLCRRRMVIVQKHRPNVGGSSKPVPTSNSEKDGEGTITTTATNGEEEEVRIPEQQQPKEVVAAPIAKKKFESEPVVVADSEHVEEDTGGASIEGHVDATPKTEMAVATVPSPIVKSTVEVTPSSEVREEDAVAVTSMVPATTGELSPPTSPSTTTSTDGSQASTKASGDASQKPIGSSSKAPAPATVPPLTNALSQKTSSTANKDNCNTTQQPQEHAQHHNDSEWETVSTRSRGRKNNHHKPSNHDNHHHHNHAARSSVMSSTQPQLNHKTNHNNTAGNNKDHRHRALNHNSNNTNHQNYHSPSFRRKNNATRKIARDIVYSVLDGVDDEVRSKQEHEQLQQKEAAVAPQAGTWLGSDSQQSRDSSTKPTAASVLMSIKPSMSQQLQQQAPVQQPKQASQAKTPTQYQNSPSHNRVAGMNKTKSVSGGGGKQRQTRSIDGEVYKKPVPEGSPSKFASTTSRSSGLGSPPADQSTAPTYQETVSALSSTSNTVENGINATLKNKQESSNASSSLPMHHQNPTVSKAGDGGGSMDGVDTATHPTDRVPGNTNVSPSHSMRSPAPPLPTLLSPENANSTTSSVASSLEAPHGRHHHHVHGAPSQDEHNPVGYHLLDVCDRLSQDISLFMKSRAQAVSLRRAERAVLIGALQEVVSGIWPNACRVEMYGSCATMLDLPSADLDVVIIGLDNRSSGVFSLKGADEFAPPSVASRSKSESAVDDAGFQPVPQPSTPAHPPPAFIPVYSANAHRVMKLSAAIEHMPWAVQVKSIPNATVPVIKILADPSKISGFSAGSDWQGYGSASHEQVYVGTTASAAASADSTASASSRVFQPWRGSDLMNGLISLDVTFQGPEHGGLGSTEYSWHLVHRVCQETGLQNPDDTPFVQCLMALKELLVQRKLNEPYSGGLSSYALLLLLTALMRERTAIREELERVEQHRASVAATAAIVTPPISLIEGTSRSVPSPADQTPGARGGAGSGGGGNESRSSANEDGRKTPLAKGTSTSWASVAKSTESGFGSSEDGGGADVQVSAFAQRNTGEVQQAARPHQKEERKPISFADVVGKSSSASTATFLTNKANQGTASSAQSVPPQKNGAWESKPKWEKKGQQGLSEPKAAVARSQPKPNSSKSKNSDANNSNIRGNGSSSQNHGGGNLSSTNSAIRSDPFPQTVSLEPQEQQQFDPSLGQTFFPQGFDDVIEVLCLGETTSGKLLMHFLLHYGQYFDAATTAIDISGKHERVYNTPYPSPYAFLTPYIERSAPESIDPHTGMLVVDHIVIYDPLEGAEEHNVARRCFAWHQVRWIFAQSYATLSSAVEKSAASASRTTATDAPGNGAGSGSTKEASSTSDLEQAGESADLSSPLLRCLLSF